MGDWAVVGFLSNSNPGTKADLGKFLKSGESIELTKDILSEGGLSVSSVVRIHFRSYSLPAVVPGVTPSTH